MRNLRAPVTTAPAVGWQTGSPISGSRAATVPISVQQRFELAAANVLQVGALGTARGGFVEVDRDLQLVPDLGAEALGELDALFEGDAFDGDEGHHVGRADARVRALLGGEIDQRDGLLHRAEGGSGHGGGRTDEGEDAAIVIGIGLAIQQDHLGNGRG